MKSVFETSTREELISRISLLSRQSNAQWGKMNVYQMLRHCILAEEMFTGKIKIKRVLIGWVLGKIILKKVLQDDSPFGKNSPTSPLLQTDTQEEDIDLLKKSWINSIEQFSMYDNSNFIHPFFGPMTKEQVGLLGYKHADHHLRQFGA